MVALIRHHAVGVAVLCGSLAFLSDLAAGVMVADLANWVLNWLDAEEPLG